MLRDRGSFSGSVGAVGNAPAVPPGSGTLCASWQCLEAPRGPPPCLMVQFVGTGASLAGLDVELVGSRYHMSLVKKRFTTGTNDTGRGGGSRSRTFRKSVMGFGRSGMLTDKCVVFSISCRKVHGWLLHVRREEAVGHRGDVSADQPEAPFSSSLPEEAALA